jgi:flagellar hook-associated protein 1 FlgK
MSGISSVLNIARDALLAHELAMEVTGHNISNVNTSGYTRQRVLLESEATYAPSPIKLGMGVQVTSVVQCYDQYATRAIQQNTSALGENEAKASALSYLESIFNEANTGLSEALNEFWSAWQDLATNPGGLTERSALLEKADILSQQFNTMSNQLHQIIHDMNTNLGVGVGEVNQTTAQIASLNDKIVIAESNGSPANDLRDQRNTLLEKLSGLIGNQYYEDENGALTVMASNGTLLVEGNQSWNLTQEGDHIYLGQTGVDLSSTLSGGKIGAWLDIRDEIVPQYLANLDELAGTLMNEVNTQHFAGYSLSGETGLYFFENFQTPPAVPNAGNYEGAAGFIKLSSDVLGNPSNIAAGGLSGEPGDNENVLQILNIQTDNTLQVRKWTYENRGATVSSSLQSGSLDDYYQALVGEVGILSSGVSSSRDFTQSMLDYLNEVRDSVSGVNLDEEMTELLKIQRAYEAAAKLITITDEMLQSLLEI